MSSTTILGLYPGTAREPEEIIELDNSWGSAPVVWNALARRWCGASSFLDSSVSERLWLLARDSRLPDYERAVLAMTYDRAFISSENYAKAAEDIGAFLKQYPQGNANHWPKISETLGALPSFPAVGFHMTSVSENLWAGDWDEEREEYLPYDWSRAEEVYSLIKLDD